MLIEPFIILKEKIPFIEYLNRVFHLITNPEIEKKESLTEGKMKYALWDIFLSISLFTVVIGFFTVFNPKNDIQETLSVFSSQFILLIEFGYYAFFSTTSFFVISAILLIILRKNIKSAIEAAFLSSLHYARCYALFLFLFLPLVSIYINAMFSELMTIQEFTQEHSQKSWLCLLLFISLYVWCCAIPLKRFWSPFKSKFWSYALVLVITNTAFLANNIAPSLNALEINKEKACNLFLKSEKLLKESVDKRKKFNTICLINKT